MSNDTRSTRDTRQRILTAATELFRRQGYAGTGMKQIVQTAGAPFGSVYHFFPGGKAQLGEEVIRTSGEAYLLLVAGQLEPHQDLAAATGRVFEAAAGTLRELDYADPCPVATMAREVAGSNERLRQAAAEVFGSWTERLAAYYASGGLPADEAADTAGSVIALLEGAFTLGSTLRSTEPLLRAGRAAAAVVRAALDEYELAQ